VIDPAERRVTQEIAISGSVDDPRWCPDGQTLLWSEYGDAEWQRLVLARRDGTVVRKIAFAGHANFRGFSADGRGVLVSVVSPAVNEILLAPLSGPSAEPAVLAGATTSSAEIAEFFAHQPAGKTVPDFHVSRLKPGRGGNAVVIRMLGGDRPQFAANWGEIQLYLRHGVHYLSVPNTPETGLSNLRAACRYARETLGVPPERIVVYGVSTAATVTLEAYLSAPQTMGILVLVVLVSPADEEFGIQHDPSARVFVFHGELDPRPPHVSREIIDRVLGPQAVRPPSGLWHVFAGEPHAITLNDASVHATILAQLGLVPCN
jgi:dienelactone hydrolase